MHGVELLSEVEGVVCPDSEVVVNELLGRSPSDLELAVALVVVVSWGEDSVEVVQGVVLLLTSLVVDDQTWTDSVVVDVVHGVVLDSALDEVVCSDPEDVVNELLGRSPSGVELTTSLDDVVVG